MYDMAFQEDRWDAWLDKYFRGLMNLCRFGGWYGVIGQIVLFFIVSYPRVCQGCAALDV